MKYLRIKRLIQNHFDLQKKDVFNWIQSVSKAAAKTEKHLYLYIMYHGSELGLVDGDNETFSDEELLVELCTPSLQDNLKIVTFVSCRGDKQPHKAIYFDDGFPLHQENIKNLIAMYTCKKGYRSKRHPDDGVPFVEKFCQEFRTNFSRKTIIEIFENTKEALRKFDLGDAKYSLTPELKQFNVKSKYLERPLSHDGEKVPPSKRPRTRSRAPLRNLENLQ